jgi:hypothetical protein
MTPKEKAEELIDKFEHETYSLIQGQLSKQCALIAADEVMQKTLWDKGEQRFWQEVKQEIENL